MSNTTVTINRVRKLLRTVTKRRVLVIGDVMLDHFLWGNVNRISPEAPVPVVDFESESFMPGGAANVARNLTALGASVELFGLVGKDDGAKKLRAVLKSDGVDAAGLTAVGDRITTRKSRVIAHHQQVVRIDRETKAPVNKRVTRRLLTTIEKELQDADAIVVGGTAGGAPKWLNSWEAWGHITAVARGHLFSVNADLLHRHSPRIILGLRNLCETLDQARQ